MGVGVSDPPQGWDGELALRGWGVSGVKSPALSSRSTQPPSDRMMDWVLEGAGAGPLPSKRLALP